MAGVSMPRVLEALPQDVAGKTLPSSGIRRYMIEKGKMVSKWDFYKIYKILNRIIIAVAVVILLFAVYKGVNMGTHPIPEILFACFIYIYVFFPYLGTALLLLNILGLVIDKSHRTRYLIMGIILSIYCIAGWVLQSAPIEGL